MCIMVSEYANEQQLLHLQHVQHHVIVYNVALPRNQTHEASVLPSDPNTSCMQTAMQNVVHITHISHASCKPTHVLDKPGQSCMERLYYQQPAGCTCEHSAFAGKWTGCVVSSLMPCQVPSRHHHTYAKQEPSQEPLHISVVKGVATSRKSEYNTFQPFDCCHDKCVTINIHPHDTPS